MYRILLPWLIACSEPDALPVDHAPPPTIQLHASQIPIAGTMTLRAVHGVPNTDVWFAASMATGSGPCPTLLSGNCLDLVRPTLVATGRLGGLPFVDVSIDVPPNLPPGRTIYFQAATSTAISEVASAVTTWCGNGTIEAGEGCDDGNFDPSDYCTNSCQLPSCGDAIVSIGEVCDDGNSDNTDDCTDLCQPARCGDGFEQPGEGCDDGNTIDTDGCTNSCTLPACGDGILQPGEACDDGNASNTDACTNACAPAVCGDGYTQPGEGCDDGDTNDVDACNNACEVTVCNDVICEHVSDARAEEIIQRHVETPFPSRGSCWGDVTWATASLKQNQNLADANLVFEQLNTHYPTLVDGPIGTTIIVSPQDPAHEPECYWAMPLIARAWHDDEIHARLTPTARAELLDFMWDWMYRRSRVSYGDGTVWSIHGSENHDAMRKSAFLLFATALFEEGRGQDLLEDGRPIVDHLTSWGGWWKEYFRQRAREGIGSEVASPIYSKYTISTYHNIYDFTISSILRRLAGDFLTLYWADVANDYMPGAAVRGGAQARTYKNAYAKTGTRDGLRPAYYVYGWHDAWLGTHPASLPMAMSDWRPPEIVSLQATQFAEHQYISRRFGLGTNTVDADGLLDYDIQFSGGSSHIRRYSYRTPSYVLGTMTFDTARDYTQIIDQNRWMGIMFATNANERIGVHGNAVTNSVTTYRDLQGTAAPGCMIAMRDRNAEIPGTDSVGTRIFVSYGEPWNNRVEQGGWLFTEVGDAYVGVRPAAGGWVVHSETEGKMLDMPDRFAPVIIQAGQAQDYASFAAFRSSVLANNFSYINGHLQYTSENGDDFELYANSDFIPFINGWAHSLSPAKVYSSPYILGWHGDDTMRLSYPGKPSITLDFTY